MRHQATRLLHSLHCTPTTLTTQAGYTLDHRRLAIHPTYQTSDILSVTARLGNVPIPGVLPMQSSPEDATYANTIDGTRKPCSAVKRVVQQLQRVASRVEKIAIDTKPSIDRTFLANGEVVTGSSAGSTI